MNDFWLKQSTVCIGKPNLVIWFTGSNWVWVKLMININPKIIPSNYFIITSLLFFSLQMDLQDHGSIMLHSVCYFLDVKGSKFATNGDPAEMISLVFGKETCFMWCFMDTDFLNVRNFKKVQ